MGGARARKPYTCNKSLWPGRRCPTQCPGSHTMLNLSQDFGVVGAAEYGLGSEAAEIKDEVCRERLVGAFEVKCMLGAELQASFESELAQRCEDSTKYV